MRTAAVPVGLLGLLGVLAVPWLAAADPRPAETAQLVAGDCERARKAGKTCVLDLPAEELTGERAGAGALGVRVVVFGTTSSLIRVRRDFIPEIVKTAEDL
jgi:hypothetical protein